MEILLFDMHTRSGHHLEYGSRLLQGVRNHYPESTIKFLTTTKAEQHTDYFDPEEIEYLYEETSLSKQINSNGVVNHIQRAIENPRDQIIDELFDYVNNSDYDVVHLLHADDILKELHRYGKDVSPAVVATINGSFFRVQSDRRNKLSKFCIETNLHRVLSKLVPDILSRRGPWNYLNLERVASDRVVDEIFVASPLGMDSVAKSTTIKEDTLTKIPDPVDPFHRKKIDKVDARKKLNIPADDFVLTFFGVMRAAKGVEFLLRALSEYKGDSITVILAGKPVEVDKEQIQQGIQNDRINMIPVLEFVPQDEIPLYFLAADAFVLPYQKSFGKFRTSGVFQKACGSGRPLIAPDFGTFSALVNKWDLGETFEPESEDSLCQAIETVVSDPDEVYNQESMLEYANSQTYEKLTEITVESYERVITKSEVNSSEL
ncbi:glycosyltransferase [Halobellus inordinatus]|uniref:glycosyltransferase n=1 Tax=Halobellus inordinatus TaxID=1126236 RepID=UPI002114ABF1|nr:glycosyltransferase [Halobellus ramosii]